MVMRKVWEGMTVIMRCDRRFVSWRGGVIVMGRT